MSGWILWVIAACAFGVVRTLSKRFWLAWFAVGSALAALLDLAGAPGLVLWIVFLLVSLTGIVVARSLASSRATRAARLRAAAALIGRQAIVLESIANREGMGCVKIGDEVWTARALRDEQVIERGKRVEVVDVKGATALVAE
jgi:membrane protein implicated in regulation of membrane protease activity